MKKSTGKVKSGAKLSQGSYVLVSRTKAGKFVIGGTGQGQLVNKHPGIKVKPAVIKPTKLTKGEISRMVRAMKVA